MSKRDIIASLLKREIPERMGLNEHFWPHLIENAWASQGMAAGTNFVDHFNLDYRSIHWNDLPGPRPDLAGIVEEDEETRITRNDWGNIQRNWKKKSGTPEHTGFTLTDVDIWRGGFREACRAIDPLKNIPVAALREAYATARAKEEFFVYSSQFVFEMLREVLGDQFMLESLLLEPEFIHEFNDVITEKTIAVFEFLFNEIGLPDGVHIYEDLGYTNAAFASPQCHRELILPYHKKFFGMVKSYNLPITMHTCGDFRVHLDSIIEAGVDCIQAMEAKTGMDVVELAAACGDKLCFMGNINIMTLEAGDRDAIKDEILYKIKALKKMRAPYIFMSDHSISPAVALDDYRYMLELFWENCRY